jgi:ketosteroid isomerase-like protein
MADVSVLRALVLLLSGLAGSIDSSLVEFNEAFRQAILRMDNAGTAALWAEDGVSLMPDAAPIAGKKNIAAFLDKVTAQFAGYRVTTEEIAWKDQHISGDWASEWGVVHQEVAPPEGKAAIEVYGRIALVLHREAGRWKIEQEVWQSTSKQLWEEGAKANQD